MVVHRALKHYRRGGLEGLLAKSRSKVAYEHQHLVFGIERAVLNDRQWYEYTVWRNQRGVDAAADPRELRYVDPTNIRRVTSFNPHFCWRKLGAVRGGDWDRNCDKLEDKFASIYQALEARYIEGREWDEIPLVQEALDGDTHWHHHSGDEIWQWCEHLDQLFESIRTDGYRTERELLGVTFSEACESNHDSIVDRLMPVANGCPILLESHDVSLFDWLDDVRIDIGRDGELLRHDGRHRLWFAQHLDLERIPVCVIVRHERWQGLRDEIAGATTVSELSERARRHLDHPDMVDVIDPLEPPVE